MAERGSPGLACVADLSPGFFKPLGEKLVEGCFAAAVNPLEGDKCGALGHFEVT